MTLLMGTTAQRDGTHANSSGIALETMLIAMAVFTS